MRQFTITDDMQASKGTRLAHLFIDYFGFFAILVVLMFAGAFITAALGYPDFMIWLTSESITINLVSVVLYLLYYFIWEATTARTLGKLITGTIIVDENGEKPTAYTAFIRTICRLIPFEYFSFLGERGWHDSISKTYVVKKHIYLMRKNEVIEMDEIGEKSEII